MRSARRYTKRKRNFKKKRVFRRRQVGGQVYTASSDPSAPITVSTLAITGEALVAPWHITSDSAGNFYVCEDGGATRGHTIKKLVPNGSSYRSILIAGVQNSNGFVDGPGATAKFSGPRGIAVDSAGNIYVADNLNRIIRRIDTTGTVTTLAGGGTGGASDGVGKAAIFQGPSDIVIDSKQLNLYVADRTAIRKIGISNGAVSTVASGFSRVFSISIDSLDNLYFSDFDSFKVNMISPSGVSTTIAGTGTTGSTDGRGLSASFSNILGIANDSNGNIYVIDTGNSKIRLLTRGTFNVTTLAGTGTAGATVDGASNTAVFNKPSGACVDSGGNVYVADTNNNCIRVIKNVNLTAPKDTKDNVLTTVAGNGTLGFTDATGKAAQFKSPTGVCIDPTGIVYVADFMNHSIRRITPAGVVTTFAGNGTNASSIDGTGKAATFNGPYGIFMDPVGNLFVAENSAHKIRRITPAGVVTTFAGSGAQGAADGQGTAAQFRHPTGMCMDSTGNLYVVDNANNKIRRITPTGLVTTFAGSGVAGSADGTGVAATFNAPFGICIDSTGNFYVTNAAGNTIRKITPAGVVTTIAGSGAVGPLDGLGRAAAFGFPQGICIDRTGNIYFTANGNNMIFRMTPEGNVRRIAGSGQASTLDGPARLGGFLKPNGIGIDSIGNLYIADTDNHMIRLITMVTDRGSFIPPSAPFSPATQVLSNPVSGKNDPPSKYTAPSIKLSGGTRKIRRGSSTKRAPAA